MLRGCSPFSRQASRWYVFTACDDVTLRRQDGALRTARSRPFAANKHELLSSSHMSYGVQSMHGKHVFHSITLHDMRTCAT